MRVKLEKQIEARNINTKLWSKGPLSVEYFSKASLWAMGPSGEGIPQKAYDRIDMLRINWQNWSNIAHRMLRVVGMGGFEEGMFETFEAKGFWNTGNSSSSLFLLFWYAILYAKTFGVWCFVVCVKEDFVLLIAR